MAPALGDRVRDEWLSLPHVAEELGVTRAAVYLMVTNGKLDGEQQGPYWRVRRSALEAFKADYEPAPTAGRQFGPRAGHPNGPEEAFSLLVDWGDARVDELAEVLGRHEGNVRKYLRQLEVRGLARRRDDGMWEAVTTCDLAPGQTFGQTNDDRSGRPIGLDGGALKGPLTWTDAHDRAPRRTAEALITRRSRVQNPAPATSPSGGIAAQNARP